VHRASSLVCVAVCISCVHMCVYHVCICVHVCTYICNSDRYHYGHLLYLQLTLLSHIVYRLHVHVQSLKEETEMYVTSKEVAVEIHFLVAGLEYVGLLDIPEVPDNSSISMSLESACAANGAKADIRIKVRDI
jgi:hypothetical protein